MKVTVIDSIMGSGKTTSLINMMNENTEEKFIYITPYRDEIDRVIANCSNRYFETTKNFDKINLKTCTKYEDLIKIIEQDINVVSTHALFQTFDENIIKVLKEHKYTLVLDEVAQVVEEINISSDDIRMLINDGVIAVNENKRIIWLNDDYDGEFIKYKESFKNGEVYLYGGSVIIWCFPCEIFDCFDKVIISTYLFKGQLQCYYFQVNNIEFEYKSAVKSINNKGEYEFNIVDYTEEYDYKSLSGLINIYEGKLNSIGEDKDGRKKPLSSTWYKEATGEKLKLVQNNTYNYFRHVCDKKSNEVLWTVFKFRAETPETKKNRMTKIKPNGYNKSFETCNCRATNKYRERDTVAYLINRYNSPAIINFFKDRGAEVDEDAFALSELLQFIWRSCIRDGKPINVYIPSKRMRNLLKAWLNGGK